MTELSSSRPFIITAIISSLSIQLLANLLLSFIKLISEFTLSASLRFASYPSILQQASYEFDNQKGFIKISKNIIIMYLIIFFAFSTIAGLFLFNPFGTKQADAAWFNDNWAYRKAITLPTHAASENNVYLSIAVDTATLISEGKLQSDCDDMRFTMENGEVLAYYILSGCNTATTSISVNFKTYPAGVVTIYFYYGNPTVAAGKSASNFSTAASNNGGTTVNEQVSTGTDDAIMSSITNDSGRNVTTSGIVDTTNNAAGDYFSPGSHGANDEWTAGARFQTVNIPQGSIIISASFILTVETGYTAAAGRTIAYHVSTEIAADDDADTFAATDGNLNTTARPRSTADCGTWDQTSTVDEAEVSRDVTSCVQEIINDGGWVANNDMVILVDTAATTTEGEWQDFYSYDNTPAKAPKLQIVYGTTSVTTGSEVKAPSPTLYWKLDDPIVSNTIQDSSANGLDGTTSGTAPAIQPESMCVSGKCIYGNGSNDQSISRADNDLLDFAASDNFTISAWIKHPDPISSASDYIITKSSAAGATFQGYKLYMDDSGDLCFRVGDGTDMASACTSGVDFDDGSWHYVAGVKAGTTSITLYIDGLSRATATPTSVDSLANSGTFYVAVDSDAAADEWRGFLDEIKVTRDETTRTAAQVLADYNSRSNPEGVSVQQNNNIQNMPGALTNGLVGFWKMDEAGDAARADFAGNGNSLTESASDTVTQVVGKFGFAGDFESGDTEYLSVADSASLSITGNLTLAAWIKPETVSSGSYNIMGKWDGSNESYRLIQIDDEIRFEIDAGNQYVQTTASNLTAGTWYHVVGVYTSGNNATAKIYINGAEATTSTTGTIPSSIGDDAGAFAIGVEDISTSPTGYYDGVIDEARVYNRALSNTEVSQLYNWAPGPISFWKFDERTGTTAYDASENAKNGTLAGAPDWRRGKYGGGLLFDGSTSNDRVYANLGSSLPTADFTYSAWLYPTAYEQFDGIFSAETTTSGDTDELFIYFNSGAGQVTVRLDGAGSDLDTTGTVSLNTWTYLTVTRSGATVRVYFNGAQDPTTISKSNTLAFDSTCNLLIGLDSTNGCDESGATFGGNYSGYIDQPIVYNYARTPAQIIEDMNAGHPAPGSPVGSPLVWWKFNEGAAGTCSGGSNNACNSGSQGSNNDGVFAGNAFYSNAGKSGKAMSLDGTGDYMTAADHASLEFGSSDFTITNWLYLTAYPNNGIGAAIYAKDSGGANFSPLDIAIRSTSADAQHDIHVWATTANGSWNVLNDSDFGGGSQLTLNTWHHFAFVRSSGLCRIYIDNVVTSASAAGISCSGSLYNNSNTHYIGGEMQSTTGTGGIAGNIDDYKIYMSALSVDQLKTDMNQASGQIMGALSDNAAAQSGSTSASASQEYCIPGDSSTCTAPIFRMDFNERSGTPKDLSGNNHSGTLGGNATFANGKIGSGMTFDGNGDYVQLGTPGTFPAANTAQTIEAWFWQDVVDSNNQNIISLSNNSNSSVQILRKSNSDADCPNCFGMFNWGGAWTTNAIAFVTDANRPAVREWHHVAYVETSTTSHQLYIDGVLKSSTGQSAQTGSVTHAYIGSPIGTTEFWSGKIDNVMMFNYARTPAQIAWDYNRGKPVAWYKFDECQGTSINDSTGNVFTGTQAGSTTGTCNTSSTFWGGASGNSTTNSGKINYAGTFDGTNDRVTTGSISPLALGGDCNGVTVGTQACTTTTYSWGGWFYPTTSAASKTLIEKDTEFKLRTDASSNAICGAYYSAAFNEATSVTAPLTLDAWNHVMCVRSGTSLLTYVNGVLRNTTTIASTATSAVSSALHIGQNSSSAQRFQGRIDEIKVFNYNLTAAQIKILYTNGAANFAPSTGAP